MINRERQKINKMVSGVSICLFDLENGMPLNSFIKRLKESESKAIKKGFSDVVITFDGGYEGCTDIEFHGTILETAKERDKRVQKEERAEERRRIKQEKQDAKDLEEYERLKKKFES